MFHIEHFQWNTYFVYRATYMKLELFFFKLNAGFCLHVYYVLVHHHCHCLELERAVA